MQFGLQLIYLDIPDSLTLGTNKFLIIIYIGDRILGFGKGEMSWSP
jgi:hypothetical protein